MWYLYSLLGIYIVLPLLKRFIDQADKDERYLILGALAILDFVFPTIRRTTGVDIAFSLPLGYELFYVFMGYELSLHREFLLKWRRLILISIIAIASFICLVNVCDFYPEIFTDYNSPLIALLAMSIFGFFETCSFKENNKLWKIDRLCFGVYLIHPVFIQISYRALNIKPTNFDYYMISTPLFALVFAILAFAGAKILTKVPVINRIIK